MNCPNCGVKVSLHARNCYSCGYLQPQTQTAVDPRSFPVISFNTQNIIPAIPPGKVPVSEKSKTITIILWAFLGIFGAHHFYAGRIGLGLLYLFTIGILGVGWLVDFFLILTDRFKDIFGNRISQP
ncbi:MAG: NINE protein [Candidatus Lokiarchaeota archaeon]|nr:NINE protein [Candidatus Lokiarchaeota archaeon]